MIERPCSRRQFGLVVAGVLSTVGGCSSPGDSSTDRSFVLGTIYLENERSEPVEVELRVERSGTEVFRDSVAIDARRDDVVHQRSIDALRCETGEFRFAVKLAGADDWTTFSTAEWESSGVFVSVRPSGELAYGQSFGEAAECRRSDAATA